MYKQVDNRHSRFLLAELTKDTTSQWDLIAAAVEEANIRYHGLVGKKIAKMRGRPMVTFKKMSRNILQGIEYGEDTAEQIKRIDWRRKAAGDHTVMGNRLINIARRMKANARNKGESERSKKMTNSMAILWKPIASRPKR